MRIFFDLCNPKVFDLYIFCCHQSPDWNHGAPFKVLGANIETRSQEFWGRGGAGFNYCSVQDPDEVCLTCWEFQRCPDFQSIDVNKGTIQLFPQAMGGEHCKLGWTSFSSNMAAVTGEITVPLTIVCILVQLIFVVSLFISILSL